MDSNLAIKLTLTWQLRLKNTEAQLSLHKQWVLESQSNLLLYDSFRLSPGCRSI
jgi:hypothetical protein